MKLVATIISGLFLVHVSIAQDAPDFDSKHGKNVATIAAYDADGRLQKIGTGFIVDPGLIITSAHVVRDAHYISSTFSDAVDGEIRGVEDADREFDLAVLTTTSTIRSEGLVVAKEPPKIGSEIVVIGSPMGLKNNITTAVVSALQSAGDVELFEISAPLSAGSSGSPVLNVDGEVVGIVSSTFGDREDRSVAVSGKHLKVLLGSQEPVAERQSNGASYSIVVSSETSKSSAEDVAQSYRSKGYEAQVLSFRVGDATRFRVCLGTYDDLGSARSDRDRLASADLPDDSWVVQVP